jgi:CHAT domain-containing protein/tetratricopeptide (TPR) repeat protein
LLKKYTKMKNILVFLCLCFWTQYISAQANFEQYSFAELDSILAKKYDAEDFKDYLPYAQAFLQRAEKSYGKQDTLYALALYHRANYQIGISKDFELAEKMYKEAAAIQKQKTPISTNYSETLLKLGYLYYNEYLDNPTAKLFFEEAIEVSSKANGRSHEQTQLAMIKLAALYNDINEHEKAEHLYLEVIADLEQKGDLQSDTYSEVLNQLGYLYMKTQNYSAAEQLYLQLKTIDGKISGKTSLNYVSTLIGLGHIYYVTDNFKEAERYYLEAKTILEETKQTTHAYYISNINNLAALYAKMRKYEQARDYYLVCLEAEKKQHPSRPLRLASTTQNLALVNQNMSNFEEAEKLMLQALAIREPLLEKNANSYLWSLNQLGNLYYHRRKYPLAWQYLNSAIANNLGTDISNNINEAWADTIKQADYISNAHIQTMLVSLNYTYQLLAFEQKPDAKQRQIIITNISDVLLKKLKDNLSNEQDKSRISALSYDWLQLNLAIIDPNTQQEAAFELAERNKSSLLLQATNTANAYKFGDLPDSLAQQEKNMQQEQAKLQAFLLENRSKTEKDSLRAIMNNLNISLKTFKSKIEQEYPKYASIKYEQKNAAISDIQKNIDAKTALIEYVVADSILYIFYIDKQSAHLYKQAIKRDTLNDKIQKLQHSLSNYQFIREKPEQAYYDYTQTAYWFYQNILAAPLQEHKNITHLIIIPDQKLGYLPFETFLSQAAPSTVSNYQDLHYLVRQYQISYNYSATLWIQNLQIKKRPNNGQFLAMAANYNLKIDSSKAHLRLPTHNRLRKSLQPLAGAENEVKQLSEHFKGVFSLDKAASERQFKQIAPQYNIIHLAMHGLLDAQNPTLSALAFSEDSDSSENNFLQAYEISQMQLNANLVVLSACETGYGNFEKGNGLASLARAFMYAGVPALVVSLWEVNDQSTAIIMQAFYYNLANGQNKAEALQNAKQTYISQAQNQAAHPAYWSPFIQLGDFSPIAIAPKNSGFTYIWLTAVAVLVASVALFFWSRRKKNK